jgi:hypothetical protein
VAFARIDLNPGLRDKLDFDGLVKKFPTKGKSTTDVVTSVEKKVSESAGLDYTTDVKPWFGGQAGVAAWPDASGQPVALLVFASKNDAAATKALAKVQAKLTSAEFGFVVKNGYALVAGADKNAQAEATAAATAASSHNLADNTAFKSALGHLSGHNLLIAYADEHQVGALLSKTLGTAGASSLLGDGGDFGGANPLSSVTGLLGSGDSQFEALKGTIIVGGSITDNGIEVRTHAEGQAASVAGSNVRPTLDAMPDTTIVGFALDGADPNGAAMKQLTPMLSSMLGGALGGGDPTDPHASAPDPAMIQAISGAITGLLTSKVISLAFTGLSGDLPSGFFALDTRDAAAAQKLMATIQQFTGGETIPGVEIANNGTHLQASMGGPASSGKLSSVPLYRQTMTGMSTAGVLIYVDVQKIVKLVGANGGDISPDDMTQIAPIKAIGISSTTSGSSSDGLLRVIITK